MCASTTRRTKKDPKDYAVDGALYYAQFVAKYYDVLAIGASGTRGKIKISHYLHFKDTLAPRLEFGNELLPPSDYIKKYTESDEKYRQDYDNLRIFLKDLNKKLYNIDLNESKRPLLLSAILLALEHDKAFSKSYRDENNQDLPGRLLNVVHNGLRKADISSENMERLKLGFGFIGVETSLCGKHSKLKEIIGYVDREVKGFSKNHKYRDVISEVYIEFLRYANADKGMGIVLTPPHVTELFADLARVDQNSVVYDNCAGTGGFLISAMRRMIESAPGDSAAEKRIKSKQLYGVEKSSSVYPLAVSNMYINQDGKSNILIGDCFDQEIMDKIKSKKPNIGLLNPPYSTRIPELQFVLNNLACLRQGGTCIALLPISKALAAKGKEADLREELLRHHTLEGVLSLPDQLFFNSKVGIITCAMIITAHQPHPPGKQSFFGYYKDDGFEVGRKSGRSDYKNKWNNRKKLWIDTFQNRKVVPGLSVMKVITARSEWVAEAYMETDYTKTNVTDFEETLFEYSNYLFRNRLKVSVSDDSLVPKNKLYWKDPSEWQLFSLADCFEITSPKNTPLEQLKEIGPGDYPYVTAQTTNNGVQGFYDYFTEDPGNGVLIIEDAAAGFCTYHNKKFSTASHSEVLRPRFEMDGLVALFIATIINKESYRFSWGRPCGKARIQQIKIKLPAVNGAIDVDYIRKLMKSVPYSSNIVSRG